MRTRKHIVLLPFIISLALSCDDNSENVNVQPTVEKIARTTIGNEKRLENALNRAGFSNSNTSETSDRSVNGLGTEIDCTHILKVLQNDSVHYSGRWFCNMFLV